MKTLKLILAAALVAGAATIASAGPSPDLNARMNKAAKDRAEAKAVAAAQAKTDTSSQVVACNANCSCCAGLKKS